MGSDPLIQRMVPLRKEKRRRRRKWFDREEQGMNFSARVLKCNCFKRFSRLYILLYIILDLLYFDARSLVLVLHSSFRIVGTSVCVCVIFPRMGNIKISVSPK